MVGQQLEGESKLLTLCAKKSELFIALLTVVTKKVNCNLTGSHNYKLSKEKERGDNIRINREIKD